MAGLVLRDAVPDDAPDLARICTAARAAALPGLIERYDVAEVACRLAGTVIAKRAVPVAALPGRIVGHVGCGLDPARGRMVFHLHLGPGFRRRGIGSSVAVATSAGQDSRPSLFCIARNRAARDFRERRGFRPAAFSHGASTEENEPDVPYVRDPTSRRANQRLQGEPP